MQPSNSSSSSNPLAGIMASLGGASSLGTSGGATGTTQNQSMNNPLSSLLGGSSQPGGASAISGGDSNSGLPLTSSQDDVTQKGSNPGGSKFLMGALQQMNNYITDATDPQDITIARSIIKIITNLIQRDQSKQQQMMGQTMGTGRNLGQIGGNTTQPFYPAGASNTSPSTGYGPGY